MKKSFVVLLHLGFWLCYFILIAIMLGIYYRSILSVNNPQYRVANAFNSIFLFAFIPSFISYWAYYFFLFPRYLQKGKIFLAIILGILISAIAAVIGYILLRYLIESGHVMDMDEGGIHGRSTALRTIAVMTFIGSICGSVALVIKGFITWYNEIKLKEMLKEKNFEMEMALVKSQLDPHLLFNTINNIDVLIQKDAVKASEYLNKLSDIMRFMLYEAKSEKIELTKELSYIEKYIELQRIRTTNPNYIQYEVKGNPANRLIEPMLFIPFIENAFKHAENKKVENAIQVKLNIDNNTIRFECENAYSNSSDLKPEHSGLGNELIKRRLELLYPKKHTFDVKNENGIYKIALVISI